MFESIYECLLGGITVVTIVFQFYIFYLIKYESPRKLGNYRFFLYMFVSYDLIFTTLLGLFLQPVVFMPFTAAKVQGLIKYAGVETSMFTAALIFYCGTVIIAYQNMSLLYRYSILNSNRALKNILMSNYSKVICGVFIQIIAALMGFFMYHTLATKNNAVGFMYFFNKFQNQIQVEDDAVIIVIDLVKPPTLWFLSTVALMFIASEIVSVIFVCMILITLNRNIDSFSHNAYKVHKQFTLLLGVQLLIPIVFIFFPVCGFVCLISFGLLVSKTAIDLGFLMLTAYGLFNSLVTVLFISSYKWHFYENFICPWLKFVLMCIGLSDKLPKKKVQPEEAPPTTTDQHIPRNKIDVCGAGLQLVEIKPPGSDKQVRY